MAIERRRYPRAAVTWPVFTETIRGFTSGEIKDISLGGAFIRCREPLKLKEVFEMHFTVAPLSPRIKATAEVVWSNISLPEDELQPCGMGIRFAKISDENRKVISTLVSDHLGLE